MLSLFRAEMMKIRRSLIWLVVIGIPLFLFGILLLGLSNADERVTWQIISLGASGVWAYFLLPMSATIITALLGQIEHRHGTWSFPLSLPYRKYHVFLVKGLIAAMLMALMSLLIWGATLGAGVLAARINPDGALMGSLPYGYLGSFIRDIWLSSFMLIAVQFYVAMRFGGMAIPLLVGVGGTLFAVVAAATSMFGLASAGGEYLPWNLPANIVSQVPEKAELALWLGGVGGAAVMALLCLSLARKDWA